MFVFFAILLRWPLDKTSPSAETMLEILELLFFSIILFLVIGTGPFEVDGDSTFAAGLLHGSWNNSDHTLYIHV